MDDMSKFLPGWISLAIVALWFLGPRVCDYVLWRWGWKPGPKAVSEWRKRRAVKRWMRG
jgi:hypothetical protein